MTTVDEVLTAVEVSVLVVMAVVVLAAGAVPEVLTVTVDLPRASPEETAELRPDAVKVETALLRTDTAEPDVAASVVEVSCIQRWDLLASFNLLEQ